MVRVPLGVRKEFTGGTQNYFNESKKVTFMNQKTSLNVKKDLFIKNAFDVWFLWLISVATLLDVQTMLFQLTKISTKMDKLLNLNPKKRRDSNEGTLLQGDNFVVYKIVWTCVRSLIKINQD